MSYLQSYYASKYTSKDSPKAVFKLCASSDTTFVSGKNIDQFALIFIKCMGHSLNMTGNSNQIK